MKQNTISRPTRQNRITRPSRWTLARIPAHVRALIDAEAKKWHIDLGQAVANLIIRKGVAA